MTRPSLAPFLAVALAFAVAAPARAQVIPPGAPGLSLDRFAPPTSVNRIFQVPTARTLGFLNYSFDLVFDYANAPLVIPSGGDVVSNQLTAQLMGAIGFGRVEVGLALPATLYQNTDYATQQPSFSAAAIGDLRLDAKVRLTPEAWERGAVAVEVLASFPTGSGDHYTGEQGLAFAGRLVGDLVLGRFTFAAYAGYRYRTKPITFIDLYLADEIVAGAGAQVALVRHRLDLFGEAFASIGLRGNPAISGSSAGAVEDPVEALGGLKLAIFSGLHASLGAGAGITNGYGSPKFRVVAGLGFAHVVHDTDGDGIPNESDRCPTEPEDKDGFQDEDGCPDPDNDNDGVLDGKDRCPNEAEDKDGFEDEDGCPDPDNDKDGILDGKDRCPNEPEDKDGFEDEDGCPDPDNDKDGILDGKDKCPNEPEDKDGFEDDDGCPDPDNDKDGIPDAQDKCPNQPETMNGFEDEDGCPDTKALVSVGATQIKINDRIYFDTDSVRVKSRSFPLLSAIAKVMNEHLELKQILIAGHTDERGTGAHNLDLSKRRAASVRTWLVKKGHVDAARLSSEGFGVQEPVVPNAATDEDREKNRRVEFRIQERAAADGPQAPSLAPMQQAPPAPPPPATKAITPAPATKAPASKTPATKAPAPQDDVLK